MTDHGTTNVAVPVIAVPPGLDPRHDAASMRALAGTLDARAASGWRLDSLVDGGWAHLVRD